MTKISALDVILTLHKLNDQMEFFVIQNGWSVENVKILKLAQNV